MNANTLTNENDPIYLRSANLDPTSNTGTAPDASLAKVIDVQSTTSFVQADWRALAANPIGDGRKLAAHCLNDLQNRAGGHLLAPQLFILLSSIAYLETAALPALRLGIEQETDERLHRVLPLIVSAYRDNIFQESFVGHGAILICIGTFVGNPSGVPMFVPNPLHCNCNPS
jgi:hypothetical protein